MSISSYNVTCDIITNCKFKDPNPKPDVFRAFLCVRFAWHSIHGPKDFGAPKFPKFPMS